MRCINRRRHRRTSGISYRSERLRKRRRIQLLTRILIFVVVAAAVGGIATFLLNLSHVTPYETKHYDSTLYKADLFAQDILVLNENIAYPDFVTDDEFFAASLINLADNSALLAQNMHEKVYPASITKLLTTYVALKHANLEDIVTVSENATNLPSGSSRAWLKANDRMTLEDLLYSLLMASGNDSAIAIAEHVSGTEEAFAELMNKEARLLGATNSHFTNSHGYHDDNHYTTAYDIYLIMKECIKNQTILDMISCKTYNTAITEPNGYQRKVNWEQTNLFVTGGYDTPAGITILGGKTGTTDEAKACLIIYCEAADKTPYLATIMGAESRYILYKNMGALLATLSN